MSKASKGTHAQLVIAAPAIAIGDVFFGTINLPGIGPWVIHHIWGQMLPEDTIDFSRIDSRFYLQPKTSDLKPYPTPSFFPFPAIGSYHGAPNWTPSSPLKLNSVRWVAPGKTELNFYINTQSAITANFKTAIGIIYSPSPPFPTPASFSAYVTGDVVDTTENQIGTITLSQSAKKITGIIATISHVGAAAPTVQILGHIRLDSADFQLTPAQFPCNNAFGIPTNAQTSGVEQGSLLTIPLDIPVKSGARIDVFVTSLVAPPASNRFDVYLQYE